MGHARVGEAVPEVRWLVADEAMRQDVGCNPYRVGSLPALAWDNRASMTAEQAVELWCRTVAVGRHRAEVPGSTARRSESSRVPRSPPVDHLRWPHGGAGLVDQADPVVAFADIDARIPVRNWVTHLVLLPSGDGQLHRPVRLPADRHPLNSDQNAHLNQQPRRPGEPGGQSIGAIQRQSRLSHTRPSRATQDLRDRGLTAVYNIPQYQRMKIILMRLPAPC